MTAPRLRSLTVKGFRAYGAAEQTLNLPADIAVVWGSNSTGKTSLAEAVEFLLTGRIARRELMASSQDEFADALRNAHLPPGQQVYVAATVIGPDGASHQVKRVLTADYAKKQDCKSSLKIDSKPSSEADLATIGVSLSQPPLAAPVLAQHTLSYIFSVRPQDRATYFKALLEVTDLDDLRNDIAGLSGELAPPVDPLLTKFDALLEDAPPDHSTISRTRRLIDVETHRAIFTWVQQRLVEAGLLKGKTVAIDATTLEANAAMRSIVPRDTGESYQAFLTGLATASGIETPTREDLARVDKKRKKKTSNTEWTNPHDPDAKVTKMKDGRTHLAHKAEHAVDLDTGAIVAVTLQGADQGDTTTIVETVTAAAEQVEDAQRDGEAPQALDELVGDKGYHSNQTMVDLDAVGIRSYIAEPDRGRRDWSEAPDAQAPVYGNRRRMHGRRGRRLMRRRGETIERSFAHLYDTGGMRRTHLRGHTNILKRVLIHAGGFNLGLVMRQLIGAGTPRGLQGRLAAVLATLLMFMSAARRRFAMITASHRLFAAIGGRRTPQITFVVNSSATATFATGC